MSEPTPERITMTLAEVIEHYQASRRLDIALAAHRVTVSQVAMLTAIAAAPAVRLRDVARLLNVAPTVLTLRLDRLEHRGLVARVARYAPDGSVDRRSVAVELTDAGRDLLASLATIEVAQ